MYSYVSSEPTVHADPRGLWRSDPWFKRPKPPPPREPIAQSPADIAKELRDARVFQVVVGACIGIAGLPHLIAGAIAVAVDTAAAVYVLDDPIVYPTNPPKTAPKPPGGGAG